MRPIRHEDSGKPKENEGGISVIIISIISLDHVRLDAVTEHHKAERLADHGHDEECHGAHWVCREALCDAGQGG